MSAPILKANFEIIDEIFDDRSGLLEEVVIVVLQMKEICTFTEDTIQWKAHHYLVKDLKLSLLHLGRYLGSFGNIILQAKGGQK